MICRGVKFRETYKPVPLFAFNHPILASGCRTMCTYFGAAQASTQLKISAMPNICAIKQQETVNKNKKRLFFTFFLTLIFTIRFLDRPCEAIVACMCAGLGWGRIKLRQRTHSVCTIKMSNGTQKCTFLDLSVPFCIFRFQRGNAR